MKPYCKFAKWLLVALTTIYILTSLTQILPLLCYLAAFVVMFPPTESRLVQKFSFLEKGIAKFLVWFVLVNIGFQVFTTPDEMAVQAQQRVERLTSERNVKELIQVLQKQEYGSANAAEALGNLGDRQAVAPLIAVLQNSTDIETRRQAAESLGKLNDSQAIQPLLKAINDADPTVSETANKALQQLAEQDPEIVQLKQQKNVKGLLGVLQKQDYRAAVVVRILRELGDKQAIPPLIKILETSTDTNLRLMAADTLGTFQDDRIVQPLIDRLGDSTALVATKARVVLKQVATQNPKVVNQLLTAWKAGNSTVRETLVSIGAPVVEPLINMLKDAESTNRIRAAELLGQLGDRRAIPPLVAKLTNWEFAPTAGTALKKLQWTPESDVDKVHFWVGLRQGSDLEENWEMTKQVLLKDIQSKDPGRIRYGLYTFISVGNQDVISTLIQTLKNHGNKNMALVYLNCGESKLEAAAEQWATSRGYRIIRQPGVKPEGPTWGNGL